MNVLLLSGVVDDARWVDDNFDGPTIGGVAVIPAALEKWPLGRQHDTPLTVMLAHGGGEEIHRGRLMAYEGHPDWSDVTPGDSPEMSIWAVHPEGDMVVDLLDRLWRLDGQTVTLRIDDGPVSA